MSFRRHHGSTYTLGSILSILILILSFTNLCKAQVEEQTREFYAWLEEKLRNRDYFGGSYGFTWADAAVVPLVHRSIYYGFPPAKGIDPRQLRRQSARIHANGPRRLEGVNA